MTPKDIAIIITASILAVSMFLIGAVYHICEYIKSKRPHKSDDEEDNPIIKFKDDLAEIYEDNPNSKLKKLAQAVWNRVEEIEKWHDEEISDIKRRYYSLSCDTEELKDKCNRYNKEVGEWVARYDNLKRKFEESEKCLNHSLEREANLRKANEGLNKLLKDEQEKNKIPIFSDQTEVPAYLIGENTFGSQINPFAKVILNTKPGEPLTATEATELAERLQNMTSQPIVLDSETLNEPTIKNEEFIKQLRDWWGLEADTNKWPDFMMKVNCVPKEWNRYRVTVQDKCGVTYTDYDWAPSPMYLIHKYKESGFTVLSYDLDNPVYRGEESTT